MQQATFKLPTNYDAQVLNRAVNGFYTETVVLCENRSEVKLQFFSTLDTV